MKTVGIILGVLVILVVVVFLIPPKVSYYDIPAGYTEKQFDTGEVTLNYVEGPDNGTPLLLITGQSESWQGYKLVMPELAKSYHVYVVEVRGQGKSTFLPGTYTYNTFGQDMKLFLEKVIQQPAYVSGVSSGGVITIWLAAYMPEWVLAAIPEDPPIFSSLWPRIQDEKYMRYLFERELDAIDSTGKVNIAAYYSSMGLPQDGKEELLKIPAVYGNAIALLYRINAFFKPNRPYDVPFLSYEQRMGIPFLEHYDTDFAKSTLDGRLSAGFDPVDALSRIQCPTLFLKAHSSEHPYWKLVGAMSQADVDQVKSLVKGVQFAELDGSHALHMGAPEWYLQQVSGFLGGLVSN